MTLTFDADNTRRVFTVTLVNDNVDELDETILSFLELESLDPFVKLVPSESVVLILDDDGVLMRKLMSCCAETLRGMCVRFRCRNWTKK